MPLQNRVNPFGELVATPHRGTLMGNRGCLHDERRQIRRGFVGKRWIVCVLDFRGRNREVMTPGRYTELFFVDEATAFAAGHRPCAECQRDRFDLFRRAWGVANSDMAESPTPTADQLDDRLHAERLTNSGGKRIDTAELAELPPGVMVQLEDEEPPLLVSTDGLRPWGFDGYEAAVPRPPSGLVRVLTPSSVVRTLAQGFPVGLHRSARARRES